jgi:hypothetical protein
MIKVDVARDGPFDRRALDRARSTAVEGQGEIMVCSADDTILAKLEWYWKGGEVSERQWTDMSASCAPPGPWTLRTWLGWPPRSPLATCCRRRFPKPDRSARAERWPRAELFSSWG